MCTINDLIKLIFNAGTKPPIKPSVPTIVPPSPTIVNPPLTTPLQEQNEWLKLKPITLSKIKPINFDKKLYFQDTYPKKQIVLHHTVSGNGVSGDISTWEGDTRRIATCIIVDREGTPWQLFNSGHWASHLGTGNLDLDRHSIGIEIDSWGWLVAGNGSTVRFGNRNVKTVHGKYYTYYGYPVDVPMQFYPGGFRGYNYYEQYTDAQVKTVGELLLLWNKTHGIPLEYNSDMWDVSPRALKGDPGVWSHVSYRRPFDKTDCHPQPNLVSMLKSISRIIT